MRGRRHLSSYHLHRMRQFHVDRFIRRNREPPSGRNVVRLRNERRGGSSSGYRVDPRCRPWSNSVRQGRKRARGRILLLGLAEAVLERMWWSNFRSAANFVLLETPVPGPAGSAAHVVEEFADVQRQAAGELVTRSMCGKNGLAYLCGSACRRVRARAPFTRAGQTLCACSSCQSRINRRARRKSRQEQLD